MWRNDDNPEEVRFASEWARENALNGLLAYILTPERHPPPQPSDRDEEVAAAVIRWLASPIGNVFLHRVGWARVTKVGDHIIGISTTGLKDGERVYEVVAVDGP